MGTKEDPLKDALARGVGAEPFSGEQPPSLRDVLRTVEIGLLSESDAIAWLRVLYPSLDGVLAPKCSCECRKS